MRLLLDTSILLWAAFDPERLPLATQATIEDPMNEVAFSFVSIWEIAIKFSLGRANFRFRPETVVQEARLMRLVELPFDVLAATTLADLPLRHRDPFDRLLIAQAMSAPWRLFTADRALQSYSDLVTLVG